MSGAADGKITITAPSGGYGTYEYSIDGEHHGRQPEAIQVLPQQPTMCGSAMQLIQHVRQFNPNLLITEPLVLSMSSTGNVLLNCFNDATGSGRNLCLRRNIAIYIHCIGDKTGATIAAPGFNSQSFFGAAAGTITVGVLDLHGCFASATINVTQPALLTPGTIVDLPGSLFRS